MTINKILFDFQKASRKKGADLNQLRRECVALMESEIVSVENRLREKRNSEVVNG